MNPKTREPRESGDFHGEKEERPKRTKRRRLRRGKSHSVFLTPSRLAHHVGASYISLAPTYFISQSALMPLLLLSKSNPLRWASIWLFLSLDI